MLHPSGRTMISKPPRRTTSKQRTSSVGKLASRPKLLFRRQSRQPIKDMSYGTSRRMTESMGQQNGVIPATRTLGPVMQMAPTQGGTDRRQLTRPESIAGRRSSCCAYFTSLAWGPLWDTGNTKVHPPKRDSCRRWHRSAAEYSVRTELENIDDAGNDILVIVVEYPSPFSRSSRLPRSSRTLILSRYGSTCATPP